jgi:hypothetical protein
MRRGSLGVERRGQTIDAVFAHTGRRSSMSSITRMEFGDEATAWHIASIFCRISASEAEVRRGMSRERSLADRRDGGAVLLEMRDARQEIRAVLPAPCSPRRSTLLPLLRVRMVIMRRVSGSRPTNGSKLSWRASSVRSIVYFVRRLDVSSSTLLPPEAAFPFPTLSLPICLTRIDLIASSTAASLTPASCSALPTLASLATAQTRCHVSISATLSALISLAVRRTFPNAGEGAIESGGGSVLGRRTSAFLREPSRIWGLPFARVVILWRGGEAVEEGGAEEGDWGGGSRRTRARCRGVSCAWAWSDARS